MSGREGEDNWIYSESSTTPERGIDQSRSVVLLCSSENVFFSKLVVVFHPLHLFLKKEKQEEKKTRPPPHHHRDDTRRRLGGLLPRRRRRCFSLCGCGGPPGGQEARRRGAPPWDAAADKGCGDGDQKEGDFPFSLSSSGRPSSAPRSRGALPRPRRRGPGLRSRFSQRER